MLYHGTLIRHLPAIEANGLIPGVGEFTKKAYGESAKGLVPAVFFADESGLERVVHALVAAVMNEISDEDYERYEIGPHYHFNDELFYKYAVLVQVIHSESIFYAGDPPKGIIEPLQVEDGDWYSLTPVGSVKITKGDELAAFLEERGLTPSSINGFVDPETKNILSAPGI